MKTIAVFAISNSTGFQMKKILFCIAMLFSISCQSQTKSDRFNDGVCFRSVTEKTRLSGPNSISRELLKWQVSNFDVNNRGAALASPGGQCYEASDDCYKKNLSHSDYEFIRGMNAGTALLQGPQDPKKLPNLEIGLMHCQIVRAALSEEVQKKSGVTASNEHQKNQDTTLVNLPVLAGPIAGLKNCKVVANADAPLKLTCIESNYALLDKELNAIYKQKMLELSESNKTVLKQHQRAWLKKKIDCRPKGLSERDDFKPSMAVDAGFCENELTSERILELRKY